jgi:hypothetical protein
MDNLGIMLAVTLRGNEILPCIRILRGIDTATRQYSAPFQYRTTYWYVVRGTKQSDVFDVQLSSSTLHAVLDDMWVDVDGPTQTLSATPDAGTNIICIVQLFIPDTSGALITTSLPDTKSITPSLNTR